ncbi:MAG TPA: hypothetical protein VK588_13080 [Chitinophagaceae bacterium]|nr:hypothetical protein [Chitinophagaceae bacterium]
MKTNILIAKELLITLTLTILHFDPHIFNAEFILRKILALSAGIFSRDGPSG